MIKHTYNCGSIKIQIKAVKPPKDYIYDNLKFHQIKNIPY